MPHVIVEYSANIEAEITPQQLVEEIHAAAITSGIAEPVAVRTRLKRREHFRVGDGSAENAFVHIDIRARKGRTLEQKKHAVQTIYDQANKTLEPVFQGRPLALTVEIHEIDPETRLLRNGMRERQASAITPSQWQIAAHAGVLPAMEDLLVQSVAAKDQSVAAMNTVTADMVTVQGLIDAVQSGPVASVAGKTGAVTLIIGDIAGLVDALASKATTGFVTSQVSGKQNASAKLDAFVNLVWAANKVQYSTGAGTLSQFDITDYMKTLMDDPDVSTALSTLGVTTYMKTVLSAPDSATARGALGVAAPPDVPVKASTATVAAGTDDVQFATALGIANTYTPKTAGINTQTGTSYTLVSDDNGKIIRFTSNSAVSCVLPSGVTIGHNTMIEQFGTGQVTINVATNATRRAFGGRFKLAGQYATASVFCELNSDGSHAEWNVSGNLIS